MDGLEGFPELEAIFRRLAQLDTHSIVERGAIVLQEGIQENIRTKLNKNSEGVLESDVQIVFVAPTKTEVGIQEDVYGHTHEFGATITPKRAQALHFEANGEEIFAQKVVIPPRPFMRPAAEEKRGEVADAMADETVRQIQEAL